MSELTQWLLGVAAVALGASIQGATGFGFAVLSIPLLTFVYGPHTAVVIGLCLGVVTSGIMVARLYSQVDWRSLFRWVAYAVVGMPLGVWVFRNIDPAQLKVLIAIVVGVLALVQLRGARLKVRYHTRAELAAALSAGTLATSVGMAGPPMVLYASAVGYEKASFRATISSFGLMVSSLSVAALVLGGSTGFDTVVLAGTLTLGIIAGLLLGFLVHRGFSQRQFDRVVPVTLLVLAVITAFGAV